MNAKNYLKTWLFLVGIAVAAHAQLINEKRLPSSTLDLPNGQRLEYLTVLKTVDKSPVYSAGMVVFNQLLLHTPGVGETIIYQTPSSLDADFEAEAKSTGELPIAAMMEKNRLDVMQYDNAGYFSVLRFTQANGRWELTGNVWETDFDDTTRFAKVVCTGVELIGLGTVQLKMSDGSKRVLTIDDEGVVRENGKVHEYTNVIKDPDLSQEQHYKNKQLNFLSGYFLPRDVNGVPVAQINAIKRRLGIVDAPKGGASEGGLPGASVASSSVAANTKPQQLKTTASASTQDEEETGIGSIIGLCLAGAVLAWVLMRLFGKQSS